jgi:hypothetical protein
VAFANLPPLASANVGDMWNISDDFVTTADFREGAGIRYGAGSNVYKTGDGKWDVTSGQMIMMQGATESAAGTPGSVSGPSAGQQNHFWTGGGIWALDTANLITTYTTEDDANTTTIITSAGGETAISTMESGAKHSRLFNKVSRTVLNTRKLINTVKRIWTTIATSWAKGETYVVGDVRLWTNGHTYVCKQAHTSSSSLTPANTTYWEDKTLGDMICSLNSNYTNLITNIASCAVFESYPITNGYRVILRRDGMGYLQFDVGTSGSIANRVYVVVKDAVGNMVFNKYIITNN